MPTFEQELTSLLNRYSKESDSNTPDFLLAMYLQGVLTVYSRTVSRRDRWFGIDPWNKPGDHASAADVVTYEQPGRKPEKPV